MSSIDVTILGCGWAGIITAYLLLQRFPDINIVCIDKDIELGGLLRSEVVNGFVFDISGSHIIFSRDQEILGKMLSLLDGNVVEHRRKTYVYLDDVFVPYPFENGIWALPPKRRAEILISFVETLIERARKPNEKPRNLREWIYGFFGKEIAKAYLEPYNEKIWKRSLDIIDVDWIYSPGRLPIPEWKNVIRSGAGVITEGYVEQAKFYYPLKGGIQALYNSVFEKAVSKGLNIIRGVKVEKIKKIGDKWVINNSIESKRVIPTIPLNELTEALNAPEYILQLIKQLDYNNVVIVGIALGKQPPNQHWIYVPNKDIIFHRYAWISNYSPYNAPSRKSALIAEITTPPSQRVDLKKIKEKTINGLTRIGVIEKENEILFAEAWFTKYAYPVHTHETAKARREILEWLKEIRIHAIGRWGLWRYINMDKVVEIALKFVETLSKSQF